MHYYTLGLGNPSERYANTRHNVGAMVVARYAERLHLTDWKADPYMAARLVSGPVSEELEVSCLVPTTYMNESGRCVTALLRNGVSMEQVLVVHDDIDLPLGTVRISYNRGSGGHNGVRSIDGVVGSSEYTRLRVGVVPFIDGVQRKPKGEEAVDHFLLKVLSAHERDALEPAVLRGVEALDALVRTGREAAMQQFNAVSE
jgi:PTH1 family peptidyl-tRNA hydrolase